MNPARYAVGIDLGTTHCVMAYAELRDEDNTDIAICDIPQLVAAGQVEAKPALPSFLYLPHAAELDSAQCQLPWQQDLPLIGQFGRDLGSKTPNRIVSSAKSWLCHGKIDRRAGVLPLEAPEDIDKLSPYEVSRHYLQHMSRAWSHAFPELPLSEQNLVITVPASFDPSARDLTMEAAREAGIANATLLEEPQAALYSWIAQSGNDWREQVSVGDVILVVDVGGGTTDLSLIAVTEEEGALQLTRVAVGDHILLGGDNMDLTLAHVVAQKLAQQGKRLQAWQISGLAHACRGAKEVLLSDNDTEEVPLVVPSRGSSLMGGSLRSSLSRDEVKQVLVEGFFPRVGSDAELQRRGKTALSTVSLPYESDPAVTRHLASFLSRQRQALVEVDGVDIPEHASFLHPSAVLFNGGVAKADTVIDRIVDVVDGWLAAEGASPLKVLQGIDVDQAVARGASYFAQVRQGKGVRIRGGTAASYYVGVESAMPAIPGFEPPLEAYCLAPFGMEEGSAAELPPRSFALTVGEPVQFRFFESKLRREDVPGSSLEVYDDGELNELPAIEVTLDADQRDRGEAISVQLQAAINELGTLELTAVEDGGEGRWQIRFDTRGATDLV